MKPRLKAWVLKTHGAGFELVRHFLDRFFDSEMVTVPGQWAKVAIGVISTLVPAALLVLQMFWRRYGCLEIGRPTRGCPGVADYRAAYLWLVRADELWLIALAMCGATLVTTIYWRSLLPDRRDLLALASLPVSVRGIFAGKFGAVLMGFAGFVLAMNLLPSALFAVVISGRWQANASLPVNIAASFLAMTAGCVFAFFGLLALQGVLFNILPPRLFERVSVYVQTAVFIGVIVLLPFLWQQPSAAWWPPTWFLGLWAAVVGADDGSSRDAVMALTLAALAGALAYLVSCRRYRRLLLEIPPRPQRQWRWASVGGRMLDSLIRDPREQAMLVFIWKTLSRSRIHRLILQICVGLGLAWAVKGVVEFQEGQAGDATGLQFAVVFAPLAVSVCVIFGLRYLFSLPSELPANWVFQTIESDGREAWLKAVDRFVVWCGLGPIYVCAVPVAVAAFGWWEALRVSAASCTTALLIFEFAFRNWRKAPFACSYLPGKRPIWQQLLLALAALSCLTFATVIVLLFSHTAIVFAAVFPLQLVFWRKLRRHRKERQAATALAYADAPVPAIEALEIPF